MRSHLLMLLAASLGAGGTAPSDPARLALAAPPAATVAHDTVPRSTRGRRTPVALRAARAVLDGVGIESGRGVARVEGALRTLERQVERQSDPDALRTAFQAYYNYRASHPERVRKPYLYYVDYGLDARTPRGYVFDMERLVVVDGPFTVAHGRGSRATADGVPTSFSNRNGSNATSLGLFLAQETYAFRGTSSGQRYRSVGLRLLGLSGRWNSAARARGVVAHGAPYVTRDRAGRSEGCPAMEPGRAERLLPRIAEGGLVFLFSPRDRGWMRADPWVNGAGRMAGR